MGGVFPVSRRGLLALAGLMAFGPARASDAPPFHAALTGAEWVLSSLDGVAPPSRAPTLTIAADGRVAGFSGCNRYFGPARFEQPGAISVGDLGLTRMACAGPAMALEAAFVKALRGATGWRLADDVLTLNGPGGVLAFRRG